MTPECPILTVDRLSVELRTEHGWLEAVSDLSFTIERGRTLALVGESGCGKSVTALSILRLLPGAVWRASGGAVYLNTDPVNSVHRAGDGPPGVNLLDLATESLRLIRGRRIAMIFQEPSASLNPVLTIGDQIGEVVGLHQGLRGRAAKHRCEQLLAQVGLSDQRNWLKQYPHQLSGGMCQRVMIATALAGEPSLLIADEPTTALDVKTQFQILELLARLQQEHSMSILLITHDFGVVQRLAHHVCVMYAGRIIERATRDRLLHAPQHPYTRALLDCLPSRAKGGRLMGIPGVVPPLHAPPAGCRFHPRCPKTRERAEGPGRERHLIHELGGDSAILRRCVETTSQEPGGAPVLREVQTDHWVACWEV